MEYQFASRIDLRGRESRSIMFTKSLTIGIVLSLILAVSWIFLRPFSKSNTTLRLPGTVEIHEVRLGSKVGGRVKSVHVKEGQAITVGQTLVELDVPELLAQREQAQAQLDGAQARLKKSRVGPRSEEKAAAHASVKAAAARQKKLIAGPRTDEIEQARGDMEAIAAELTRATSDLTREQALLSRKASTPAEVEEVRAVHGRFTGQMHAAKARLRLLESGTRGEELLEADAELARTSAEAALLDAGSRPEDIEESVAEVQQLRAKLREIDIQVDESRVRASTQSIVEVVSVRPGDVTAPNQPMIRVLEPDQLWVKAYVSEVDLGKVRLNQPVTLTVDAYPGRHFPGTVNFIASSSEFTPRNVQTTNERRYQVFALKVLVDDAEGIFKSGLAADVWIPVDE